MLLKNTKTKIAFLMLCTFCFQFACSINRYRQPILKFQAASALVTANARSSLMEVNRLQISRVITEKRLKGQDITNKDIEGAKLITFEDLQVRLDALDRVNEYADLLVSIANSDAPENIAKSATDLNTAIGQLNTTVMNLSGNTTPTNFKGAFSLAGSVLSEILRAVAQKKIKEALDTAILKGEKPVNTLIDAIANDLSVAYDVKNSGFFKLEEALIAAYKLEAAKDSPSEAKLTDLANKINANRDVIEILQFANPKDSLTQMKKTHSKLVIHAKTKTPASFADAVEEIEVFVAAVKRLGDAVQELKKQNI